MHDFVKKWESLKILNKKWAQYIKPTIAKPGNMYGLIKTHKEGNPARVITSGCGTAIEFLSIFVEKCLYNEMDKITSRIKDTPDMLNIIDDINNNNIITEESILVSFDVVYMFPSIDNVSGIEAVSEILRSREANFPPAECIIDALKLCLECNNSFFNNVLYLQEDGTAMGPHMSCSYSDIAMFKFDLKALSYRPGVLCWKRFRDDIFVVWNHSLEELNKFFEFMNDVDTTGKIKFTMSVARKCALEFLDLSLHINEQNKICVDVYAKPTNSFTYVLPSTCYPKRNINNVPKGIALRLRRICDSDEKFDNRSHEYQNYLIARDYNPSLVKKHFNSTRNISRNEARQVKEKTSKQMFNLITVFNPLLQNLQTLISKNLPILYSDPDMKEVFPEGTMNVTYSRGKNLKELVSPSLFPQSASISQSMVSKCGQKCDICDNYLVTKNFFSCKVTGKTYKVRGNLTCCSKNVVYILSCKICEVQYVGSAFKDNFKKRFRVHKSDVNTGKDRCGVGKHFLSECSDIGNIKNMEVQPIEQVLEGNQDVEGKLWNREKYWQAQLFTLSHGMNSSWDWYSTNRKGYRKNKR